MHRSIALAANANDVVRYRVRRIGDDFQLDCADGVLPVACIDADKELTDFEWIHRIFQDSCCGTLARSRHAMDVERFATVIEHLHTTDSKTARIGAQFQSWRDQSHYRRCLNGSPCCDGYCADNPPHGILTVYHTRTVQNYNCRQCPTNS